MKKWRLAVTGDVRTTVLRFMLKMIDLETYYLFSWSGKSTIDSEGNVMCLCFTVLVLPLIYKLHYPDPNEK